jgi:hypothetical protein
MNIEIDLQRIEDGHQSIADLFRLIIQRGLANNISALPRLADAPSMIPTQIPTGQTANNPTPLRARENNQIPLDPKNRGERPHSDELYALIPIPQPSPEPN